MTPNVDLNLPPETWITAAPQDTITGRDGTDLVPPQIGTISVRYHMYWAGSDQDGSIAGFYYAVVETLPQPAPGFTKPPPLPGPKARDYHFTTRTDSIFIFNVSEYSPDRQHAFYIYAVDDKGKADPTPARVIFNALDRFPPLPVFEYVRADGYVYLRSPGGMLEKTPRTVFVHDSLTTANFFKAPSDTVPINSLISIRWHGEPTIAGTYVTGFEYKLDEPSFVRVDATVDSARYNTEYGIPGGRDVLQAGTKVFTLKVLDQAGGAREANRRWQMNYSPQTWFSGPDPSMYPRDPVTGERYVDVSNWNSPPPFPGSLLSCDSLSVLPADRPPRKTFFEIYTAPGTELHRPSRVYVRSENDTVDMNSWVLVYSGGSDLDSPYLVQVNSNDPSLAADTSKCPAIPGAPVLRPGGPNGSPIGFRQAYSTYLTPSGPLSSPSQSSLYPLYDATSVFRQPVIGGYQQMRQAGKVYAVTRAQDGDNERDRQLSSPRAVQELADKCDAGNCDQQEMALRSKILTFYVDKAPRLLIGTPGFVPDTAGQSFPTRQFTLNLLADDVDPATLSSAPGGPAGLLLRWAVTIRGRDAQNDQLDYLVTPPDGAFNPQIQVDLPPEMTSTVDTVKVQLCDCAQCEDQAGSGRCVNYNFPITVPPPVPGLGTSASPSGGPTRPGSPIPGRRRAP